MTCVQKVGKCSQSYPLLAVSFLQQTIEAGIARADQLLSCCRKTEETSENSVKKACVETVPGYEIKKEDRRQLPNCYNDKNKTI